MGSAPPRLRLACVRGGAHADAFLLREGSLSLMDCRLTAGILGSLKVCRQEAAARAGKHVRCAVWRRARRIAV